MHHFAYEPRQPTSGVLHQIVKLHLEAFFQQAAAGGDCLPRFIEKEFRGLLACGALGRGFARFHCSACTFERLVPFSCKARAAWPSGAGRRMTELATHLVDDMLPPVPVRQWGLTMPYRLRYMLAWDRKLCRAVLGVYIRALLGFLRKRARWTGILSGNGGAATVIQRFGSAMNVNLHFHALLLYACSPPTKTDSLAVGAVLCQLRSRLFPSVTVHSFPGVRTAALNFARKSETGGSANAIGGETVHARSIDSGNFRLDFWAASVGLPRQGRGLERHVPGRPRRQSGMCLLDGRGILNMVRHDVPAKVRASGEEASPEESGAGSIGAASPGRGAASSPAAEEPLNLMSPDERRAYFKRRQESLDHKLLEVQRARFLAKARNESSKEIDQLDDAFAELQSNRHRNLTELKAL